MNVIFWWIYEFLSGWVVNYIGFWFAVFEDHDWGRQTMEDLGPQLTDNTMMGRILEVVAMGGYGA